MPISSKKAKVWLISLGSVLLATLLVLSGVGLYFKFNPKTSKPETKVNPLDFSIDAWDGKSVSDGEYNVNYAGRGTETRTIDSAESFIFFIEEVNSGSSYEGLTVYLNTSIDLKGHTINSIGNEANPFKGTFDGGFYTLYNLNIKGNGLFGQTENATIKNIGLYNPTIKSTSEITGGLIGKAINTTIDSVFVKGGTIKGERVGGLVGEYIINQASGNMTSFASTVETKISNSFVDTTIKADNVGGLVHTLTNEDDQLVIEQSYFTNGTDVVANCEQDDVETLKVVNPKSKSSFKNWDYSSKYEKGATWCDYEHLEGSRNHEFNYPIQSGFVKVYLTGSHYESVVITEDKVVDISNLSDALTEINNSTKEAVVNLIVEKVFMEARAEAKSDTVVTINAVEDTTLVRGEHNEDSMFVATEDSKIILGSETETLTAGDSTIQCATMTLDGNREQVEKENLESGALVVGYGGSVEIHDNVILQNNVNTNVGYGGAVLLYNSGEESILKGTVENCFAEYSGGGVCVVNSNCGQFGSASYCSTKGNGGYAAILSEVEETQSVSAMTELYGGDSKVVPAATVTTRSEISSSIDVGTNTYKGCNSIIGYGGAFYINTTNYSGSSDGIVYDFTFMGSSPANLATFEDCWAAIGGAICVASIAKDVNRNIFFANLDFKNNYATNAGTTASSFGGGLTDYYDNQYGLGGGDGGAIFINSGRTRQPSNHSYIYSSGYIRYVRFSGVVKFSGNYAADTVISPYRDGRGGSIYSVSNQTTIEFVGPSSLKYYAGNPTFYNYIKSVTPSVSFDGGNVENAEYGGAIYSNGAINTNGYMKNLLFKNSKANLNGGAIYSVGSVAFNSPGVSFENNEASQGGAVYSKNRIDLQGASNTFNSNVATTSGGALYSEDVVCITYTATFSYNRAQYGGALYAKGRVDIRAGDRTVAFTSNGATSLGGAIYSVGNVLIGSGTINFNSNNGSSGYGAIYCLASIYIYESYYTDDDGGYYFDDCAVNFTTTNSNNNVYATNSIFFGYDEYEVSSPIVTLSYNSVPSTNSFVSNVIKLYVAIELDKTRTAGYDFYLTGSASTSLLNIYSRTALARPYRVEKASVDYSSSATNSRIFYTSFLAGSDNPWTNYVSYSKTGYYINYNDKVAYTGVAIANTYTVLFKGNGHACFDYLGNVLYSSTTQAFNYSECKSLTANTFSSEVDVAFNYNGSGHNSYIYETTVEFLGWYSDTEGGEFGATSSLGYDVTYTSLIKDAYYVKNLTTENNGTVTLNAQWEEKGITITTPTRTGYIFKGWNTKADGSGIQFDDVITFTSTLIVFAQWQAITSNVAIDHANATNLIQNPSFENTGWNVNGSSIVYSSDYVRSGGYSVKLTGTTSTSEIVVSTSTTCALTTNHIYYVSVYGYQATKAGKTVQCYWPIAEPSFGSVAIGAAGQWNLYSFRLVRSKSSSGTTWSGNYSLRFDFDNAGAAGTMYFDDAKLIDLTATYGSGNEPSKDWCDTNLAGMQSVVATYDKAMPSVTKPTRTGYIFNGIYDAPSGGTQYYTSTGASARTWNKTVNTTLYAQWTPITYTVAFNKNNTTATGSMDSITCVYDTSYTLPSEAFTLIYNITFNANGGSCSTTSGSSEFGFTGWAINAGGSVSYADKAEGIKNLTTTNGATVTLYAKWSNTVSSAYITLPTPTKTGYQCTGWWTLSTGGSMVDVCGAQYTYSTSHPTTLYAQWSALSYTMTYTSGGGTITSNSNYNHSGILADKSLTYDTAYTTQIAPSSSTIAKPGYTFGGFYVGTDFRDATHTSSYLSTAQCLRLNAGTYNSNHFTTGMIIGVDVTIAGAKITNLEVNDISVATDQYEIIDNSRIVAYITVTSSQIRNNYSFVDIIISENGNYTYVINEFWTSTFTTQLTNTSGILIASVSGYTNSDKKWQHAEATFAAPKWTANAYTVTYNANGGTVSPASKSVTFNTVYGTLATPTKPGYTFNYWQTNLYNQNMAVYKDGYYYNGSTGAYVALSEYDCYKAYVLPNTTYTITNSGGSTAPGYAIFNSSGTVLAKKNYANTVTVTFTTPANASYIVFSVVTLSTSNRYDKTTFKLYGKVDSTIRMVQPADHTLDAVWRPNTYTVTYNSNGGSGTMVQDTVTYGTNYTAPKCAFTAPTGHHFSHWNEKADDTGSSWAAEVGKAWSYTKNITLYAQWDANTYTVTYNSNGGLGTMAQETVTYGTNYAAPECAFTAPTGYSFSHWNEKADNTGSSWTAEVGKAWSYAKDITLYAQWTANSYNLTLDDGTYQRLDFIQSTGTQYIDTGFIPNQNTKVSITFTANSFADDGVYVYGAGVSAGNRAFELYPWSNTFEFNYGNTYTHNLAVPAVNTIVTAVQDKANYSVTYGGKTYSSSYGAQTFTAPYTLILAGLHRASIYVSPARGNLKIYGCEIYDNGTMVRNLVPAIRKSDGAIGMYDQLNEVFYSNAGTGTFVAGYNKVTYNSNYGILPTPSRPGYTFNGWYTAASGGTQVTTSTTVSTASDHTLYAQWTPITYTLTVNPNGGTMGQNIINGYFAEGSSSNQISAGGITYYRDNVGRIIAYGKNDAGRNDAYGYVGLTADLMSGVTYIRKMYFTTSIAGTSVELGWFLNPDRTYWSHGSAGSSGSQSQFSIASGKNGNYVLRVDPNKLNNTLTVNSIILYNVYNTYTYTKSLPYSSYYCLDIPTRTGYTFTGWSITSGSGTVTRTDDNYLAYIYCQTGVGDTTITAQWTPNTYTVEYNGNGAISGSTASSTLKYDTTASLTKNGFVRTGYTFAGWNTKADGTGTSYADQASVKNIATSGTVTLYAQWNIVTYSISYELNGGSVSPANPTSYNVETASFKLNNPTKTGYTFLGWTGSNGETTSTSVTIAKGSTENKSYTANWEAIYSTVTADANGGTIPATTGWTLASDSKTATKGVIYDSTYGDLPTPTRSGHSFTGWYTTESTGGTQVTTSTKVTEINNHTIYARWLPLEYTLTYDANGGTVSPASKTVTYTSTYGELAIPTRDGYAFDGWYTSATGGTKVESSTIVTKAEDHTIYAHWAEKPYTVTANANGGTIPATTGWTLASDSKTATKAVKYTSTYGTLPTPTAPTGYTFSNWYGGASIVSSSQFIKQSYFNNGSTDETLITDSNATNTTMVNWFAVSANTVYHFETNGTRCRVQFKSSSGKITYYSGSSENGNARFIVTGSDTAYMRIYFDNASTSNLYMYLTTVVTSGTTLSVTHDHSLYAYWTPNTYTVKYDGNGATMVVMNNQTFTYDVAQNLNANTWILTGYSFTGWNTKADGTGTSYVDKASGVKNLTSKANDVVTLYAQWLANKYTIAFDANGGDCATESKQVTFHSTYGELPTPTRTGYDQFDGWYTEKEGGSKVESNTRVTTATNQTLYAHWTANKYTIEFYANGGTGSMNSMICDYDTTYNLTKNTFTKAYTVTFNANGGTVSPESSAATYTFAGWATSADGAVVYLNQERIENLSSTNNDIIALYAIWTNGSTGVDITASTISVTIPTPTRQGYTFTGWWTEISSGTQVSSPYTPTESISIYAHWEINKYTIIWNNYDGTVLETDEHVEYGQNPTYNGESPTKPSTEQYEYVFTGWSPALETVTDDVTYTATFREKLREFTITIVAAPNGCGTVSQTTVEGVQYGTQLSVNNSSQLVVGDVVVTATPTASDDQYSFTFAGWTNGTAEVKSNITVTANFNRELRTYTISWVNYNGDVLEEERVSYGTLPAYSSSTPLKESDEQYNYIFAGWSPKVSSVTGTATYTAVFTSELRQYTVTLVDNGKGYGSVVSSNGSTNITVDYGTAITVNGNVITINGVTYTPTPNTNANGYSYAFKDWSNIATQVKGELIITANFIRYATIEIEREGSDGNTYGVDVYDENGELINITSYIDSFKLETDKVYTIKVVSSLIMNETDNEYQIIRVYVDETHIFTQDSLQGDVEKTVYSKSIVSRPMTIKFEYLGAYFLTVDDAEGTIAGFTIEEMNEGNNYVKNYASKNGYLVADETELKFLVDSTPVGEIDNMSTFIGFEYVLNGETRIVGVNGGTDIVLSSFTHNRQYENDSDIGTYNYDITNDSNLSSIKILTIQSATVEINTAGVSGLVGTLTLTSEFGFNKVIDSSTEKVILHSGYWTITTNDWTYEQILTVFGAANISQTIEDEVTVIKLKVA